MKSQVAMPVAVVVIVVVVIGLGWFLFSRANTAETPVMKGTDIQKPSGMQPDPTKLPPGGIPGGAPVGPAGGKAGLPPGKGR